MGFLGWIGKTFGSLIFMTFLSLSILLIDVINFTEYDNVKTVFGGIIQKILFQNVDENALGQTRESLVNQCSNGVENVKVPGNGDIFIKCSDLKNQNKSIQDIITNSFIETFYNKKFDCGFVNCLTNGNSEDLQVILSHQGSQFLKEVQRYFWIGTAAGLALLLVSTRTWPGRLKGIGFNLVSAGIPFLFVSVVQKMLPTFPEGFESVQAIVNSLFSSIRTKFIILTIIGIALIISGYLLGIYLKRKGSNK